MTVNIESVFFTGLEPELVEVEADFSRGLPGFHIIGLPDASISESVRRIKPAILNSGYEIPPKQYIINLKPADKRKRGSILDLAIAISILGITGQMGDKFNSDFVIMGELSLSGDVNHVNGILPALIMLKKIGKKKFIIPVSNYNEASIIQGIDIYPVAKLKEAVLAITEFKKKKIESKIVKETNTINVPDFSEIAGQVFAKRGLEIAVAGHHNVLLSGPPGSGKTMLASAIPSIMPELSFEESLDTTAIYSVRGLLDGNTLISKPVFRSPHHTITTTAMLGGRTYPVPGEVTLAHNGVLFLDELPEFKSQVLESLREVMEKREVHISRLNGSAIFPANFIFIGAMNPCPCGYYSDPDIECVCSYSAIRHYIEKISGPLLDRIDIYIEVQRVKYDELRSSLEKYRESSSDILSRVYKARAIQEARFSRFGFYNGFMTKSMIDKFCILDTESESIIKKAFINYGMSVRAYISILKIARTIADLAASANIRIEHIYEALSFRRFDRLSYI